MTGALRFEARVRVLADGRHAATTGDAVVVRGADAVTLLSPRRPAIRATRTWAAIPQRRVAAALDPASRKIIETLRAAHVARPPGSSSVA